MSFNKEYWENRYREKQTGWDLGEISPPLKQYIDQLKDREKNILIPGAGNAYEAEYLFKKGYKNVYVLDMAPEPLINFRKRMPSFPEENLLQEDFFNLSGTFDLILEQTFFCALSPENRPGYVLKMAELLNKGGKLAGVFFKTEFSQAGPPFGGSRKEYIDLFAPHFHLQVLENCYNSISPRKGNELFFIFIKK